MPGHDTPLEEVSTAPASTEIALPAAITSALGGWAQQLVQDACDPLRTQLAQARAQLDERDASIDRLTVELRHARDIASEALVGKAKDQLAIDGKDAQVAELRREIERHVALTAAASDARLAAAMELVGATTARDNFAAEITSLRAQLDSARAARGG